MSVEMNAIHTGLAQSIETKIEEATKDYSKALEAGDRPAVEAAKSRMSRFAEIRQRCFTLVEDIFLEPTVNRETRRGRKPNRITTALSNMISPLTQGEYTPVKGYEPYLLRAMVLLGPHSRYIDIQKKTLELMQQDGKAKPQDIQNAGATPVKRYITQTASLRKSLTHRELIIQHPDKSFSLTDKGMMEAQFRGVSVPNIEVAAGATPTVDLMAV